MKDVQNLLISTGNYLNDFESKEEEIKKVANLSLLKESLTRCYIFVTKAYLEFFFSDISLLFQAYKIVEREIFF